MTNANTKAEVDYNYPILQALNSLRTESDVLVLYWENRLQVPHDALPSDGVSIAPHENSNETLNEILDDVYTMARNFEI